jgi:hypothetical protein
MISQHPVIVTLLVIAACLYVIGIIAHLGAQNRKPKQKGKSLFKTAKGKAKIPTNEEIFNALNTSTFVESFANKFPKNKELSVLFRKSKNPWGLTESSFVFIRYGGLAGGLILAFLSFIITKLPELAILFAAIGVILFVVPESKYKNAAKDRERQWSQLYQFIWVIKHNATFYDPKKVWIETESYIKNHTKNLPELEEGFHDFAEHWNGQYMDEYIQRTYGDFDIPKELFNIMLQSQQTGEFPESELNSLRTIIVNKMNFMVQDTLSTVGTKATMCSTPFLLATVAIVVIVPVIMQVMEAFM